MHFELLIKKKTSSVKSGSLLCKDTYLGGYRIGRYIWLAEGHVSVHRDLMISQMEQGMV